MSEGKKQLLIALAIIAFILVVMMALDLIGMI